MAVQNWAFVADKIIERQRVSRDGSQAQLPSPGRSSAATKHIGQGAVPMFGWFKSERRERRKKVRQDRKHLEERTRRFLKSYLDADQTRKPQFYRAVEDISKKCQPAELSLSQPDKDDRRFAEATSRAALQMVLDRVGRLSADGKVDDFVRCLRNGGHGLPSCGWRLRSGRKNEETRNCCCSPLNDGNVIHPSPEGIAGHPVGSSKREGKPRCGRRYQSGRCLMKTRSNNRCQENPWHRAELATALTEELRHNG
jgi:hypothetical protein